MFAIAGIFLALLLAVPAHAVGMGPLTKKGITTSSKKGFYLTVMNPYPDARRFEVEAAPTATDVSDVGIKVVPPTVVLGGSKQRRVLVIFEGLAPGDTTSARVCARQSDSHGRGMLDARVCSHLTARRLP